MSIDACSPLSPGWSCRATSVTSSRNWNVRRRGSTTRTMCLPGPRCPFRRSDASDSEPPLVMKNGLGGFTPDGREYVVVLEGERETPLPWSNVLANPTVGTIVSSSGSQFTWAGNSRENRLTPFANDPLTDPTSEAFS